MHTNTCRWLSKQGALSDLWGTLCSLQIVCCLQFSPSLIYIHLCQIIGSRGVTFNSYADGKFLYFPLKADDSSKNTTFQPCLSALTHHFLLLNSVQTSMLVIFSLLHQDQRRKELYTIPLVTRHYHKSQFHVVCVNMSRHSKRVKSPWGYRVCRCVRWAGLWCTARHWAALSLPGLYQTSVTSGLWFSPSLQSSLWPEEAKIGPELTV